MTTPPPLSAEDAARIARRYPPRRTSLPVLVALGLVVAALVGYVVWVAAHRANPPVSGRIDSFAIVSDTETRARLTVDRPDPSVPVRCFVFVQAVTYERVGEKDVTIPAGTERLTTVDVSVRTFKRGTAITVDACTPAS